jgi:pyridoxal phosphate enzyme (YggS family)
MPASPGCGREPGAAAGRGPAEELARALRELEQRLSAACAAAGRGRESVLLVAVTKTRPASDVRLLQSLGVTDVGENRDQEARAKAGEVSGVRWHFVGGLQTNKARSVASYADVVHSVDRPELVAALSAGAVRADRRLEVLLQVSLDGDPARGGCSAADLPALADAAAAAAGLELAGVMAVAPLGADPADAFDQLAELHERLLAQHPAAVARSAGMSGDLEQAVARGATHVRVGTALLGARAPVSR